jgi:hypothetical protein
MMPWILSSQETNRQKSHHISEEPSIGTHSYCIVCHILLNCVGSAAGFFQYYNGLGTFIVNKGNLEAVALATDLTMSLH